MKVPLSILNALAFIASRINDIDVEREDNIVIVYISCDDRECADRLVNLIEWARKAVKNSLGGGGLSE